MKTTPSNLIRWAGLAAVVAGILFVGMQPIHPPDVLASVTTGAWALVTPLRRRCASSSCSASRGSTPGKRTRPAGSAWPASSC